MQIKRQQRLSDASSSSSKLVDLKRRQQQQRRQSIRYPSPFMPSNAANMVSLECQLDNNETLAHIAMPLDKTFIQTTTTNTANNQQYFADSSLNLKSRHYSIETPRSGSEFWVPANIAMSSQLEKQRTSLPTNVPISFNNSERKLKCQVAEPSEINKSMCVNGRWNNFCFLI